MGLLAETPVPFLEELVRVATGCLAEEPPIFFFVESDKRLSAAPPGLRYLSAAAPTPSFAALVLDFLEEPSMAPAAADPFAVAEEPPAI